MKQRSRNELHKIKEGRTTKTLDQRDVEKRHIISIDTKKKTSSIKRRRGRGINKRRTRMRIDKKESKKKIATKRMQRRG